MRTGIPSNYVTLGKLDDMSGENDAVKLDRAGLSRELAIPLACEVGKLATL